MVGIYAIRNKRNLRMYVGASTDVKLSWHFHRKRLRNGTHFCRFLQNAFNRYGEENFEFLILEQNLEFPLIICEQRWIYKNHGLYNQTRIALGCSVEYFADLQEQEEEDGTLSHYIQKLKVKDLLPSERFYRFRYYNADPEDEDNLANEDDIVYYP